jgi:hypothetical protein
MPTELTSNEAASIHHGFDHLASGFQPERLPVLDAFRALAITAVILYHYLWGWAPPSHSRNVYGYAMVYPSFLSLGPGGHPNSSTCGHPKIPHLTCS